LVCAAVLAGAAFGPTVATSAASVTISGAGSTLVAPLEAEWASAWDSSTGNTVTYNPVGSGTGYQELAQNLVDFGASDAPLSAYSSPACSGCVQMPWAASATGISFNINNGAIKSLRLTGTVLANIYLGHITHWNNSSIQALNPGVHLPNLAIAVFWRSDASGDSFAFTKYESDVNSAFRHQIGATTTPSFPVGTGAHGNSGMVSAVQSTNGAIAYVAVSYLINAGLPAAGIKNSAGNFEVPNLSAIQAAVNTVKKVPANNEVTIVNPPPTAPKAYVISTFTYVMVHKTGNSHPTEMKQFIFYALHGGQAFGPSLDFATLPTVVVNASDNTLNGIS
jgi:phosphate transport system substrate-binding protein